MDAPQGRGCDHCEDGIPITFTKSRGRKISLCLECTMAWFPGRSVEWWESRHRPYRDHVKDRMAEAGRKEHERNAEALAAHLRANK